MLLVMLLSDCLDEQMNLILIFPLPLLWLTSNTSLTTAKTSIFFLLGPGPAELSDEGLMLALSVDVKLAQSICAWHLPNGDSLSGSSLCQ